MPTQQPLDALALQVKSLLHTRGMWSAGQLQAATGKSQPSVSRALALLAADPSQGLLITGAGRSTQYAQVQTILSRWPGQQPLFATDVHGNSQRWGTLYLLGDGQVLVVSEAASGNFQTISQGQLPWFLQSLRPQGFLGRLRGQQLGYASANPDDWTLQETLHAILASEHDAPGAFALGDEIGELLPEAPLEAVLRGAHYDSIAADVTQTFPAGSSAGGEQPKFVAHLNAPESYQRLIVKFSPPRGTPFGERWHDLLWAEHLALKVLAKGGVSAAKSRIVQSGRRTYLESVRFDRVGSAGKRHVLPLSALHAPFAGGPQQHWVASCELLAQRGFLSADDENRVRLLRDFGRLIGNTDMHFGNLNFIVDDLARLAKPHFTLAPVFDMLPMVWRPNEFRDEMGYTPFATPQKSPGSAATWGSARELAGQFWRRLAACAGVSAGLREVSRVQGLRTRDI